nr:tetratricopeptide repeat protein [Chitinispirillaceae bacterium]
MNKQARLTGLLIVLAFAAVRADATFDELIDSKKYSDASKYAEDNIPVGNRDAAVWAKLAFAYEKQDLKEKALACYMVSLRSGANYDAYLGAARAYNGMKQPETALDMAKKALELQATGEASWEYASACIALGKPTEAKAALEKVVESDPSNIVANRELGNIFFRANDFKKALPMLKTALSGGRTGDLAMMIGTAYLKQDQLDSAIVYLKIAAKESKYQDRVALDLAAIFWGLKDYRSCAENYAAADVSGLAAIDLYRYAECQEKNGGNEDAVMKQFGAAAAKFGQSTGIEAIYAREKFGRWNLAKKNFAEALAQFQFIVQADPDEKVVQGTGFLLADAFAGSGNQAQAAAALVKVIAGDPQNIEAHARLAELYTAMGQADKARQTLEKLIALQPNNPKIQLALGQYSLKAKKYEEALKYFQKSFAIEASASSAEGMTIAAWALKRTDLARDAAESALHHDSSLVKAQQILVQIYLQENNVAGARQLLESAVKQQPSDKSLWLDLAKCQEQMKDLPELAVTDKAIMGIDKSDVPSRVRYAKYALATGDLKGALTVYKEIHALKPDDAAVARTIADVALQSGAVDEAVVYLNKYLVLRPGDAATRRDLGNLLYDKKDLAGALAAYRATFAVDPALTGYLKRFADLILTNRTSDKEAQAVFSAAIRAGEAGEAVYAAQGDLYRNQGLFATAAEMYQKAQQLNPQNYAVLSSLAESQAKAGKKSEAILSYEQAIAMKPGNPDEQKSLGDLYWEKGKKGPAAACYKKYLENTPKDAKTARRVADFEYDAKNYPEAVKYFAAGGDESAGYLLNYGTAAYQTGDTKKTEELFKRLVLISPNNSDVWRTLYDIARKNRDQVSATGYLKKYTALSPADEKMLLALAELLVDQKDSSGALAAYRGVLKVNPAAKGFYGTFVALTDAKGTPAELAAAIKGAIAADEATAPMYARLGASYRKAADYPRAIAMYEKAIQLDPKNVSLLSSLAQCQVSSGAAQAAAATYEQAAMMSTDASADLKTLGDLYVGMKKNEAAVKAYKRYLEKKADNAIARFVGMQAVDRKDYPEAVKYLGMVSGEESKAGAFLLLYAKASYNANESANALKLYKQLSVLYADNAEIFQTLSELQAKAGQTDDALASLRRYVALKPGDAKSQRTLADALYERKDNAGAVAAYRGLLKADPSAKGFYKKYVELVVKSGS